MASCYGLVCNSFVVYMKPILIIWKFVSQQGKNRCLHAIHHDSIAIHSLSLHQLLNGYLAKSPTILGSFFYWHNQYYNHFCNGGGWKGATMWQGKATSTLKTAKWYSLMSFLPPSIKQSSCIQGQTHQLVMWWITAGCLLVQGWWSHLKTTGALADIWQASETSYRKTGWITFSTNTCRNCWLMFSATVWWWKVCLLLCVWKLAFLRFSHICRWTNKLWLNQNSAS